jgi:hypothetical protein
VSAAGDRKCLLDGDLVDQRVGVAMGQLPARALAAEDQGHPQRPVLVGQPADLAVLALDGHQNDQVAGPVGLKDLQIRLTTAAEVFGKRVNSLVRGVKPTPGPCPRLAPLGCRFIPLGRL